MRQPDPGSRATADVPDEALIERVRDGDRDAFDTLYRRYFKRVFHFVHKRLRSREDTEETVQEVFLNVFCSIGSYRGEAPFAAWVLGLTRRTIAGRFKKKRVATVPIVEEEESDRVDPLMLTLRREPSPLEHYECRERLDRIAHAAARELTPQQWQLFELHHLQHRSIDDLSRSLHRSQDAVKSHLYRARKVLLAR